MTPSDRTWCVYLICTTKKGAFKLRSRTRFRETPAATTRRADSEHTPSAVTCPRGDACQMSTSHETDGVIEEDGDDSEEADDKVAFSSRR